MSEVDHSYDVSATTTEIGTVQVNITMVNTTLSGACKKSVDLGEFTNHQEAAKAASEWVKTDLDVFSIFK